MKMTERKNTLRIKCIEKKNQQQTQTIQTCVIPMKFAREREITIEAVLAASIHTYTRPTQKVIV